MRALTLCSFTLTCLLGLRPAGAAEDRATSFAAADALTGWQLKGDVGVDPAKSHGDGTGSLKVGPGATATWRLRDTDGAGTVSFWAYEDGTQRADEKTRGAGPLYGIVTADGRVLVAGAVYAPYLAGNGSYALSEYTAANKEQPFYKVTYLGHKRTPGWHQWTFDFDPAKGLKITHNQQDLSGRFQWADSQVKGFAGVVVLGDQGPGTPQTTWIDDVAVKVVDAPMMDPFEQLVPKADPAVAGAAPTIVPALAQQHPRLLFSQADIPQLKAFAATPTGTIFVERLKGYLPSCVPPDKPAFLTDATDGQRQGLWRLPSVALHYVLTGEKASFDKAVGYMKLLLSLPHWETGEELDSGMSSANIMIGAALAYDWLYADLEPGFRETHRRKLWEMARRQYYIGHLMHGPGTHYWQGDPQNNHRWHRDAGLSLATLAACTGDDSQKWMMQKLADEMKYVADWLPGDGTSHESPSYLIFGAAHLTLGMEATDRCLGTAYLQRPFFAHLPSFMLQTLAPGLKQRFLFGDQGGTEVGEYNYDVFELKSIGAHNRGDLLALVDQRLKSDGVSSNMAWLGLLWYPRDLAAAAAAAPTHAFFADLGLELMRDTWAAGGRGAMFKCGPFGGYLLNLYSHEQGGSYINVAHDDPDANSFLLFKGGELVAESDRYSSRKRSANLNTILINGIGQTVAGRDEGGVWSQPGGDMSQIAVVTATGEHDRNLGIEGEAAGSYPANPRQGKRPALDRYRRSFLWIEGRYLLVLDDIRAPAAVDVDWLLQSGQVDDTGRADLRFVLRKGTAACPLQVAATEALTATIVDSPADNKGKALGWRQLRLKAHTGALRLASVYDLWDRGELSVALTADGANHAVMRVRGREIDDTWDWTAGAGRLEPSRVVGYDGAGAELLTLGTAEPETRALLERIRTAR